MNTSNRYLTDRYKLGNLEAIILLVAFFLSFNVLAELPFVIPPQKELDKIRSAVVSTSKGDFLIKLFPQIAPLHVANFKFLCDQNFYQGHFFHIYHEGYIIQGGDPTGTGNGGPGYEIPSEFSQIKHTKGIVGMARKSNDINVKRYSNGSQFHILLGDAPKMDKNYTIFGQVVDGMEVVEQLTKGDQIKSIKVFVKK